MRFSPIKLTHLVMVQVPVSTIQRITETVKAVVVMGIAMRQSIGYG
jgi:hypothetical protein